MLSEIPSQPDDSLESRHMVPVIAGCARAYCQHKVTTKRRPRTHDGAHSLPFSSKPSHATLNCLGLSVLSAFRSARISLTVHCSSETKVGSFAPFLTLISCMRASSRASWVSSYPSESMVSCGTVCCQTSHAHPRTAIVASEVVPSSRIVVYSVITVSSQQSASQSKLCIDRSMTRIAQ